jgi:MFS superfamily sulfate permease-like transporter
MNREELDRRKSLLVAQSHLHRLQARLAWHDLQQIVVPPHLQASRGDKARSIAATFIGIAAPLFGLSRLGRIVRAISIGVMVMRVMRGLRGR